MASRSERYSLNKNKYLLEPEISKLIYLLKTYMDTDKRNVLLILMAVNTGARATELLNMKFSDLNEFEESIHIFGIKGSNDREIPLPHWLFKEIMRLRNINATNVFAKHRSSEYIFPISYNRLRQIWQLYRPVEKKFHSLRHTFAIRLYQKTKDIRLLQVALGHRNITNTMVYADYIYTQSELRKLIL